jgi:hypothetical protein
VIKFVSLVSNSVICWLLSHVIIVVVGFTICGFFSVISHELKSGHFNNSQYVCLLECF